MELKWNDIKTIVYNQMNGIIKTFSYEENCPSTRNRVIYLLDRVLSPIKDNGILSRYEIQCDETNNTQDIIEQNDLVVDLHWDETNKDECKHLTRFTMQSINGTLGEDILDAN